MSGDMCEQEMTAERTIEQSGNSLVISVPPRMLDAAEIEEPTDIERECGDYEALFTIRGEKET